MLAAGKYAARATEWAIGQAGTGTEEIAIDFEITQGDNAGEHITWHGYFSENAWERTIESMRHCGWQGQDMTNLEGLDRNEVQLVVEMEPNNDGTREFAKVRWVNRIGGGAAVKTKYDGAQLKDFAQRMRANILQFDQARKQPGQQNGAAGSRSSGTTQRPSGGRGSSGPVDEPPPIAEDPRYNQGPRGGQRNNSGFTEDDIPF